MEPISIGAIVGGVVTLMGKWLNYDIEKRKLEQEGKAAPAPTPEEQKGQEVTELVRQGVQTHGGSDEQTALTGFEQNPQMFGSVLEQALTGLANRIPAFGEQLRAQAQQAQQSGIQVSFTSSGPNYGQQAGINYGGMHQGDQQHIHNTASNQGAQGTFHGSVNFGTGKKEQ